MDILIWIVLKVKNKSVNKYDKEVPDIKWLQALGRDKEEKKQCIYYKMIYMSSLPSKEISEICEFKNLEKIRSVWLGFVAT